MLTHQKNRAKIRNYETTCFYTYRAACSHRDNCASYGYIGSYSPKFKTTSQSGSMQLEYQAVISWLGDV